LLTLVLSISAALVALAPLIGVISGRIKDPFHPMVWIGIISFLLIPYRMWRNWNGMLDLVDEPVIQRFQIIVMISLLGLYLGWWCWNRRQSARLQVKPMPPAVDYDPAWLNFAALTMLAVALPVYFLIGRDEADLAPGTGYAREWSMLWVPASILAIQAMMMVKPSVRILSSLVVLLGLVHPITVTMTYGSRGTIFRLALLASLFLLTGGNTSHQEGHASGRNHGDDVGGRHCRHAWLVKGEARREPA